MLGMRPAIGHDFDSSGETTSTPVAILSYSLWQRRFAGNAGILGRSIELNGRDFTVVGVLPSNFLAPGNPDVLIPIGVWIANNSEEAHARGDRGDLPVLGRLAPGISASQARTALVRGWPKNIRQRMTALASRCNRFATFSSASRGRHCWCC